VADKKASLFRSAALRVKFFMNFSALKKKAAEIKSHTLTIYFAAKDPAMPFLAKVIAILVVAYALSPIDLIPDFVPLIGFLDDLIIVPLGLALVLRLTPAHIIASAKQKAEEVAELPVNYYMAALFIIIWLVLIGWFASFIYRVINT
jgi:uncharacterized membrane protein YkvA (DUF1232 family)